MLYSIPDLKKIDHVPHSIEFNAWMRRLDGIAPHAYQHIRDELDARFEEREVDTSSWIPGADWTGTPYAPIYYACGSDENAAAQFFGLLVWQVVMDRDDAWSFGRYEKDGVPIRGMTYFRIDAPSHT